MAERVLSQDVQAIADNNQLYAWNNLHASDERTEFDALELPENAKLALLEAARVCINQKRADLQLYKGNVVQQVCKFNRHGREWLIVAGGPDIENLVYAVVCEEQLEPHP